MKNPMSLRTIGRRGLLACTLAFLGWLAWLALAGGLRQLPRAHTVGQKVETATQLGSGVLSLLVVVTCFRQRRWAGMMRTCWGISLATAAGLSSLVWGPAMPSIGVLFAAMALLMAGAVNWALGWALPTAAAEPFRWVERKQHSTILVGDSLCKDTSQH